MPLDPQAQVVIDMIASMGVGDLTPDTDPNEIRALMNAAVLPSGIELASVSDREIPGPAGPIPVRVYRPAGDAPKPVVVYYHGGGWVLGSPATHAAPRRRLAPRLARHSRRHLPAAGRRRRCGGRVRRLPHGARGPFPGRGRRLVRR